MPGIHVHAEITSTYVSGKNIGHMSGSKREYVCPANKGTQVIDWLLYCQTKCHVIEIFCETLYHCLFLT
jgi:hypothetical protein